MAKKKIPIGPLAEPPAPRSLDPGEEMLDQHSVFLKGLNDYCQKNHLDMVIFLGDGVGSACLWNDVQPQNVQTVIEQVLDGLRSLSIEKGISGKMPNWLKKRLCPPLPGEIPQDKPTKPKLTH